MSVSQPISLDPADNSAAPTRVAVSRFSRLLGAPGSAHARILSGSLIMLVSSLAVAGVNFAYNVQVAQRLGPAEFGHVATIITLLLLASSLTLSYQIVCAKFIAKNSTPGAKAAVFHGLLRSSWRVGILLAVSFALLAPWIARFLKFPSPWMVVLLAVGIAFYVPMGVKRGGFQGVCSFPRLAANFNVEAWAKFLLALPLIGRFGAMGAVIAVALSEVVAYFLPRPNRILQTPPTEFIPWTFNEGRQAIVFFVGQVIIMNTDLVLVKHLFPAREAGIYAAVALVGRVLYYAAWSVTNAMFPVSAESGAAPRRASVLLIPVGLILGMLLGFVSVVTIFPGLMRFVFGAGFHDAGPLLPLYAMSTTAYALSVVLIAYEMSRKVANTGWLQLVFSGLVIAGILRFHDSLRQVVLVLLTLMCALLVSVAVPFLFAQERSEPRLQEAA